MDYFTLFKYIVPPLLSFLLGSGGVIAYLRFKNIEISEHDTNLYEKQIIALMSDRDYWRKDAEGWREKAMNLEDGFASKALKRISELQRDNLNYQHMIGKWKAAVSQIEYDMQTMNREMEEMKKSILLYKECPQKNCPFLELEGNEVPTNS